MTPEDKIAAWNDSYTESYRDWLISLDEGPYDEEEEKQHFDDEELTYYVRKR